MTILSEESLEFAKQHLDHFFSSDFFPNPFEFQALWHCWEEVKNELTSRNVDKMHIGASKISTAHKPKGTFRVVHQLDPVDSLIYTALAYSVAQNIEQKRAHKDDMIACSYRIDLKEGSFFSAGNGFQDFTMKSEWLANNYGLMLTTDISDFYNQIYLHRLNGAIVHAGNSNGIANDVEQFLMKLNSKASQGIPVGPTASIIMSEAIMIDIDQFIINTGVSHTRYVDDFRIFAKSKRQLINCLENLTYYLYTNHRLSLSTEKTNIYFAPEFVSDILNNHYEIEKREIFKSLSAFNPYTGETEEYFIPKEINTEEVIAILLQIKDQIDKKHYLDIGLARGFLRKARYYKISIFANYVITQLYKFAPVISDVCLYLDSITDVKFVSEHIYAIKKSLHYQESQNLLVKEWLEWYLSRHKEFVIDTEIKHFIFEEKNILAQAKIAILTNDLCWIREKKSNYVNHAPWERRAILLASQILPGDEKVAWLKHVVSNSSHLERWTAKWMLEKK